jgi:hypothetical protein
MPERQDHSKNIIGKVRINHCAKSFILWVYDVLARGVRPELLRTIDGQGFRAVPFDPSEDADETRNQSTS